MVKKKSKGLINAWNSQDPTFNGKEIIHTIAKLFWHRHPGHPISIPGADQILQKKHGKMKKSKKFLRNGNSDSWEAEVKSRTLHRHK